MTTCTAFSQTTIVNNGRAHVVVIASQQDLRSAVELVNYIEKATGVRLSVTSKPPANTSCIYIGSDSLLDSEVSALNELGYDEILICSLPGNSLLITGNTVNSTRYAVDHFLSKFVGVRWLWPGEIGEVVPRVKNLVVDEILIKQSPAYIWRNLGPGGVLWGALDKETAERKLGISVQHQRELKEWEIRNGFGGKKIYGGHAFGEMMPPAFYGPTHPEYYALVDGERQWKNFNGKHGSQPCTSNGDVIRIVTDYVRSFYELNPEYDAFSISLNDGGGFCECHPCIALDCGRYELGTNDPEMGGTGKKPVITDRILTFANAVAEGLLEEFPGKKLILFAYGQYKQPPLKVKTHPNIIIQYTFHASKNWNADVEKQQLEETAAWSTAAQNLGIYEYYIQGNFPDLPRPMWDPIQRSLQRLSAQGYRYFQTQAGDGFAINGINYYILGKLLWDPSMDLAQLREEYLKSGFGEAAPLVARYFNRWESAWRSLNGLSVGLDTPSLAEYQRIAVAYPRDLRIACGDDLKAAAKLVNGRELERVEFLQHGLRYVNMTVDAIEETIPLLRSGWDLGRKFAAPATVDMAQFKRSLKAWEERERYIDKLRNEFVISYFWVCYNQQNRTSIPLARMRSYKED